MKEGPAVARLPMWAFILLCIASSAIGFAILGVIAAAATLPDPIIALAGLIGILLPPIVLISKRRAPSRRPIKTTDLPIERTASPTDQSSKPRIIPGTYTVVRNPATLHVKAIRSGFSWLAFVLNLFGVGWIWAFANSATHLGWRLLVLSVLIFLINFLDIPTLSVVAGTMWIVFSITVGMIATDRVRSELKRLGFATIAENVVAASSDGAIEQAEKR